MRINVTALCLMFIACPNAAAPQAPAGDSKALDGLWTGAWGGGGRDGVVFQPVISKLFISGKHIELSGFRNANRLTGTVQFDAAAKRMRITPAAQAGQPAPKAVDYTYELKGDTVTLTDADKHPIGLQKVPVVKNPLANAQVQLVAASGINKAGDLLVTEYSEVRAGQAGAIVYQPWKRSLSTKGATVLLVQEASVKRVTIDEARRLLRDSTPVVVTYRLDDPPPQQAPDLWRDTGAPTPDSGPVQQSFARLLRPGTLVFVLSAQAKAVLP